MKLKILLFSVICLLIFTLGCVQEQEIDKIDSAICEEIVYISNKNSCYVDLAMINQDPLLCEKTYDQNDENKCYLMLAKVQEDTSLCEKISNLEAKEVCYYTVAIAKSDPEPCRKIKNQTHRYSCEAIVKKDIALCEGRDNCILLIAEMDRNHTLCGRIEDRGIKVHCYGVVAAARQDPNICGEIKEGESDVIDPGMPETLDDDFEVTVETLDNGVVVKDMRVKHTRMQNIFNCHLYVLMKNPDSRMCEKIKDQNFSDYCYYHIASETEPDPSLCEKIRNRELRDMCYSYTAEGKIYLTTCFKIENLDLKRRCYSNVEKSKSDPTLCGKIEDQVTKDNCYRRLAETRQEPALCERVRDREGRHYCEAVAKQDPSVCETIGNQPGKDEYPYAVFHTKRNISCKDRCYYYVASAKQDPSICEKIENQMVKEWCYERVKE